MILSPFNVHGSKYLSVVLYQIVLLYTGDQIDIPGRVNTILMGWPQPSTSTSWGQVSLCESRHRVCDEVSRSFGTECDRTLERFGVSVGEIKVRLGLMIPLLWLHPT